MLDGSGAGMVIGIVIGVLFIGGGVAVWFFFFRRTGNADVELKPRTPTPDAPAQVTNTHTTIIQQQPMMMAPPMMMQPQPVMMQPQPMMMQQPGMMMPAQ